MLRDAFRLALALAFLTLTTNLVAQPPQDTLWTIASPANFTDLPSDQAIAANGTIETGTTAGVLSAYEWMPPSGGSPGFWKKIQETAIAINGNNWSATLALPNGNPWPITSSNGMMIVVEPASPNAAPATHNGVMIVLSDGGKFAYVDIVEPPEE